MLREGVDVVITYASDNKYAEKVVKKIEELGSKAKAVKFDLMIPEDANNLLQQSVDFLGGVDILVNNGVVIGPHITRTLLELTEDDFNQGDRKSVV